MEVEPNQCIKLLQEPLVCFIYVYTNDFYCPLLSVIDDFEQARQRRKNDPSQYLSPGEAMVVYRNSMAELSKLVAPYVERPEDLSALPPGARRLLATDVRQ